jgi:hypothetical protein
MNLGMEVEALIPRSFAKKHRSHRRNYINNPHVREMGKDLNFSENVKMEVNFLQK